MSDNRSIVYREDNKTIFRASGSGSCLTALVAAALGYEEARGKYAGDIMDNAAREGTMHEGAIVEYLRELGHKVDDSQKLVESKVVGNCWVRGHVDGVGRPPKAKKDRVYEIKTMSKLRFQKWESYGSALEALRSPEFIKYGWQASHYILMMNMPMVYVVKNRDSGKIRIEEITMLPVSETEIRKKFKEVEKWRVKGELPPCDTVEGKFFCAFPYLHDNDLSGGGEAENVEPISDVGETILLGMLERRAELTEVIRAGDRADEERRDLNKRIVTTIGGAKRQVGKWSLSVTKKTGRSSMSPLLLHEQVTAMGFQGDLTTLEEMVKAATQPGRPYEVLNVKEQGK